MQTIKIIAAAVCIFFASISPAGAMSLEEAIENTQLKNYPEYWEKAEKYTAASRDKAVEAWWTYMLHEYPANRTTEEDYIDLVASYKQRYTLMPERSFVIYVLEPSKYAVQYSENKNLSYLLSDAMFAVFTEDTHELLYSQNGDMPDIYTGIIQDDMCFENLKKYDKIQEQLNSVNAGDIFDCKILELFNAETALYIECENADYMVLLQERDRIIKPTDLELLKIYPVKEFLQYLAEKQILMVGPKDYPTSQMLDVKPTYDAEAEELQEAGLLQGNENGLDLLKPLTRAEAVTLLVRALGLESETTNYAVSEFADIANDNWAAPYAALAKSRGIANGISDTEFAPDERVTSDQFAAFALRAIGESDFDYTEGTEILINKGIITEEQADTMDLFTRGDMAKIIYEMREMGLMQQ